MRRLLALAGQARAQAALPPLPPAAARALKYGSVLVSGGLLGYELHDIWLSTTVVGRDVQLDDRAQLLLGLDPGQRAERFAREQRLRGLLREGEMRARALASPQASMATSDTASALRTEEAAASAAPAVSRADPAALAKLRIELVREAHTLLYPGVTQEEVQHRREAFGNVKWTDAAMQLVTRYSPLVEVGAGLGQWQAELVRRGADAAAFDDFSSPGRWAERAQAGAEPALSPGAVVQRADAEEAVARSPGRTLLLVYPPAGAMAARCLARYAGSVLLYVGEGRGGVNADDGFFDALARDWSLEVAQALDPLPGSFEKLYVLQRTNAATGPAT